MSALPERVGPYVIEGELGRGGMGVVYRARDPSGRLVALKRLSVSDDQVALRLAREAEMRVVHPNVVRVLASGIDGRGEPYVVTELLEGKPLDASGPLPMTTLVRLFAEAADGLAAIHAQGIVHRDVKPSNLFVTVEGTLKLLDFGVATFASSSTMLTASGALVGTPAYFSPEQARGDEIEPRTDLWGLGMSLYQSLTGELPFRRSNVVACALAVQNEPLPGLFEHSAAIPIDLAAIVERCLAKRIEDRPESASELARTLRAVTLGERLSRPSQPLLAQPGETWRTVVLVLVEGATDARAITTEAERAGGEAFRIFGRASVIVLGAQSARGDELTSAIAMAARLSATGALTVVGTARARDGGRELEPTSLRASTELLESLRGEASATFLTADVATLLRETATLSPGPNGSAQLLDIAEPSSKSEALIGRDVERAALARSARLVTRGRFARSTIAGESGMGKTALVRSALADLLRAVPQACVCLGSARRGETAPYAPLVAALGLDGETDSEASGTGSASVAIDRRRTRVLDALGARLVYAPIVVLVIEDTHDADEGTRSLLDALAADFADRPLWLLETTTKSAGEEEALRLAPLDSSQIEAIVARLGGDELARRIAEPLTERAGGNPRFAIHLAELALARGDVGDVERWELPSTVETAIQARLDTLPEALRSATHTMAVLGFEGTIEEARWALGADTDSWIRALVRLGVLETSSGLGGHGWRFQSRVLSEVAYEAIDGETARRIHRDFARRLASSAGSAPDSVLRHAERGDDAELITRYLRIAMVHAARIGDGHRVLDLLPRVRDAMDVRCADLFAAAEAAAFIAGRGEPEPLLREALVIAVTSDERAQASAELGERARRMGLVADARAFLEQAIAARPSQPLATRATCRLALVRLSEGDAEAAAALLDACDTADSTPLDARALVWDTRGYVHGARGALGARREAYERAASLYAELGDARREAGARANLGDTLRELGELTLAERALRRAVDGAHRVGNGLTEAYAYANLAATLLSAGRRREALATLDVADVRARAVGDERLVSVVALRRARAAERPPSDEELAQMRRLDQEGANPMLRGFALVPLLTYGAPDDRVLAEAKALLAQSTAIEEGTLELGAALYARLPDEAVRAMVLEHVERVLATLDHPEWRATYVAHACSVAPDVLRGWSTRTT
jgi:tetratricopeptide (TPR) repeat protein